MKRVVVFVLLVFHAFIGQGQTVPLPDSNFVQFLRSNYGWTLYGSNALIVAEAAKVKGSFVCTGARIQDVQGIQYFTKVTSIDLSDNLLTSLPDFPANDSLQKLVLNNNKLSRLPNLSKCTRLRSLDVVGNQLTQLNGVEKNKGLKQLICNNNTLTQLPILDSLPNLVALDASHNRLGQFPKVGKTNKLQNIHLNNNLLTTLPDTLYFPKLVKMWLYNNQLDFRQLLKLTTAKGYDSLFAVVPQRPFKIGRSLTVKEATSFELVCQVDEGLTKLSFAWNKEGSVYQTGSSLVFAKIPLSATGKYVRTWRHPAFATLTLYTDTFSVEVSPCIDMSAFTVSTVGSNCKRSGQITVQNQAQQQVSYTLKGTVTTRTYTSSKGQFEGLEEPTYRLYLQDPNGCEKAYPSEIHVPKEVCRQALITPNGDGESDSYFFVHTGRVVIYDKRGEIVKTLTLPNEWDGATPHGRVAPGAYLADINNGEELVNISIVY